MSANIQPAEEVEALGATFAELAALRARLDDAVRVRADAVSAWAVDQHLYHVALSSDLALRNVRALVRGEGSRIVHEGGPNELALRVLADGTYPRGRSEAPRMVRPPDEVVPEYLTMEMDQNRAMLAELASEVARVADAAGRIPHVYLGELDAGEWLRFARLHAEHHLAIARDIEAALEKGRDDPAPTSARPSSRG